MRSGPCLLIAALMLVSCDWVEPGRVLCAEDDDCVVGFVCAGYGADGRGQCVPEGSLDDDDAAPDDDDVGPDDDDVAVDDDDSTPDDDDVAPDDDDSTPDDDDSTPDDDDVGPDDDDTAVDDDDVGPDDDDTTADDDDTAVDDDDVGPDDDDVGPDDDDVGPDDDDATPIPTAYFGDLVITEVMQNPASNESAEWFEVYNASGAPLDLGGWQIFDNVGSHTVLGSLILPAGARAVLGRDAGLAVAVGVSLDYSYGGSLTLANGVDEISLHAGATEVDHVAWDNGATFPDPDGPSMSLDPAARDSSANDEGENWCASATPLGLGDFGTPGLPNPSCPVGDDDDAVDDDDTSVDDDDTSVDDDDTSVDDDDTSVDDDDTSVDDDDTAADDDDTSVDDDDTSVDDDDTSFDDDDAAVADCPVALPSSTVVVVAGSQVFNGYYANVLVCAGATATVNGPGGEVWVAPGGSAYTNGPNAVVYAQDGSTVYVSGTGSVLYSEPGAVTSLPAPGALHNQCGSIYYDMSALPSGGC